MGFVCLAEGGFLVEPRDKAAVQTLLHECNEVHSERAEYARKLKVTAQKLAKEKRQIHTGRLETFEMDPSSGFDSTELYDRLRMNATESWMHVCHGERMRDGEARGGAGQAANTLSICSLLLRMDGVSAR